MNWFKKYCSVEKCHRCQQFFPNEELIKAKDGNDYCDNCYDHMFVSWNGIIGKKAQRRDRWGGGQQGDERRNTSDILQEDYDLFDQEHREELNILRNYAKKHDFVAFHNYISDLRKQGYKDNIINRLITQSMYKVKI